MLIAVVTLVRILVKTATCNCLKPATHNLPKQPLEMTYPASSKSWLLMEHMNFRYQVKSSRRMASESVILNVADVPSSHQSQIKRVGWVWKILAMTIFIYYPKAKG